MTGSSSGDSLVSNSAVLSLTMLAVSGANYGLNVAMARILGAAEFGDANLAVNIVLVAAVVAATLQLVTAKAVARRPGARRALRKGLGRWAGLAGGVAVAPMIVGAPWLSDLFATSTPWLFVTIGLGLPFYFVQAVDRGVLQGEVRVRRLAVSYGVEATVRVAGALLLLWLGMGVVGACIAIGFSFVASGLVARRGTTPLSSAETEDVDWSGVMSAAKSASTLLVGQVLINNGDVLLSKVFFSPEEAGVYATVALLGRALFFLSWSVVHAMFPLAARGDGGHRKVLGRALAMVGLLCLVGISGFALLGDVVVTTLFGAQYEAGAPLLVPYAVATSLFAIANLVATTDMAVGRSAGARALLAGAIIQSLLLVLSSSTPTGMVEAQVAAMSITVALVGGAWVWGERPGTAALSPGRA